MKYNGKLTFSHHTNSLSHSVTNTPSTSLSITNTSSTSLSVTGLGV